MMRKKNQPDLYTTPFITYRANLEKYVRETIEKGAIPILLSPVVRRNFNKEGTLIDTHGLYPLVTRMVAEAIDVNVVAGLVVSDLKKKHLLDDYLVNQKVRLTN